MVHGEEQRAGLGSALLTEAGRRAKEGGQTTQRWSYDLLPAVDTEGRSNLITLGPHTRRLISLPLVWPGRRRGQRPLFCASLFFFFVSVRCRLTARSDSLLPSGPAGQTLPVRSARSLTHFFFLLFFICEPCSCYTGFH